MDVIISYLIATDLLLELACQTQAPTDTFVVAESLRNSGHGSLCSRSMLHDSFFIVLIGKCRTYLVGRGAATSCSELAMLRVS